MASTQFGIQQLLAAEQKAQEIVAKARRDKVAKLKLARDDATKEIEAYRAKRESEFEQWKASHGPNTEGTFKMLEERTTREIEQILLHAEQKQQEVVSLLLNCITNVNTDISS
ncbi:V-type proton ATPase subunit G [Balamuthia mandrillaris]